jgi:acetyl-CoA carboxylase biotin carboxylase subunit
MLTGIDIVQLGIRAAAGEPLGLAQEDVLLRGHAIECRVNAEDPSTQLPSPGTVTAFVPPGGFGIRVETLLYGGTVIPVYYDSLIAKIIAHGRDRHEAIARMRRALEMTVIEGIKTSIPLHLRILSDPDFIAGRLSTSFMEQFLARRPRANLAEAV